MTIRAARTPRLMRPKEAETLIRRALKLGYFAKSSPVNGSTFVEVSILIFIK